MEYIALYRKYRPKRLDEVYGQNYIIKILENSILNNRFMHAYLFSGPRGTGKTTIAKLLAKIVNCQNLNGFDPCDECDSCKLFNNASNPDIIEIDAASNNGVDEIRTIRDSVLLMPSISNYKIYIIDEVHMLSSSAFNALLKTIEEPPKHIIFILATTEINKVPETIVSRCQCYDFKRISISDIVACLSSVCSKEGIEINDDVLSLVASHCNGGMRDAIGLLDKLFSYSNIVNEELFYDVVGLVDNDVISELCKDICECNIKEVFDFVEKLVNSGKSIELLSEQLLLYLKSLSIDNSSVIDDEKLIILIDGISYIFNNLRKSFNQTLFFEVEILKIINKFFVLNKDSNNNVNVAEKTNGSVKNDSSHLVSNSSDLKTANVLKKRSDFDIVINNAFALANKELKSKIISNWKGFNDYVHNKEFSSLVSYFLDSNCEVVGEKDIILSAEYESIVDNANSNITKLELLFNLVMGKSYNIVFVLCDECKKLKDKYVSDIKNGKKYSYIEHDSSKDVIIYEEKTEDLTDAIKKARDIFGKDIVEKK